MTRHTGDRFIRCRAENGVPVNISGPLDGQSLPESESHAKLGLEHFGFDVEDIDAEIERLAGLGAPCWMGRTSCLTERASVGSRRRTTCGWSLFSGRLSSVEGSAWAWSALLRPPMDSPIGVGDDGCCTTSEASRGVAMRHPASTRAAPKGIGGTWRCGLWPCARSAVIFRCRATARWPSRRLWPLCRCR